MHSLEDIRAIDAYTFCDLLSYVVFSDVGSIFVDIYARVLDVSMFQRSFLSKVFSFRFFLMKWSSDPDLK